MYNRFLKLPIGAVCNILSVLNFSSLFAAAFSGLRFMLITPCRAMVQRAESAILTCPSLYFAR
jgi:hypothetical protein